VGRRRQRYREHCAWLCAATALAAAGLLSACAPSAQFKQDVAAPEKFAADRENCPVAAGSASSGPEAEAERYDGGSAGQVIGAGIAAMPGSARQERELYVRCMKAAGHRPATRAAKASRSPGAGRDFVIIHGREACGAKAVLSLGHDQPVARVEQGRLAISHYCVPRGQGSLSPLRRLVVDSLTVESAGGASLVRDVFLQLRNRSADPPSLARPLPPTPLALDVQIDESRYRPPTADLDERHYPRDTAIRVTASLGAGRCLDLNIRAATEDPFGNGEKDARSPWFARISLYVDDSCQIFFTEVEGDLIIMKIRNDIEFRYRGLVFSQLNQPGNK
jgi:hypothetical protein